MNKLFATLFAGFLAASFSVSVLAEAAPAADATAKPAMTKKHHKHAAKPAMEKKMDAPAAK